MVDTINSPNSNGSGQNPPANTPGNSFYSGFNRPDEVHVNLAGDHKEGVSTPQMPTTAPTDGPKPTPSAQPQQLPASPQPVNSDPTPRPVYQDVKPAQAAINPVSVSQPTTSSAPASNQGVANFSEPISNQQTSTPPKGGGKGPIFALLGGLVLIVIAGVTTYFVAGTINQNKITQQNQEYKKLQSDLAKLKETPAVLELPVVAPPQSDVTVPEVKKVETPVVQPTTPVTPEPTPATPTVQPDGSQSAQG
ncbi:MAG: hypothetical protein WCI63_00120 [bacterium]